MKLNSEKLKAVLEKLKQHKNNGVIERSFNLGINSAIGIIEIFESIKVNNEPKS